VAQGESLEEEEWIFAWRWWLTPIILAVLEAEIKRIEV
jgi:hypothetical protein